MPLISKDKAEELAKRNQKMKDKRSTYEQLWQEIADYEFPRRSGTFSGSQPGAKQTSQVFDSTAIHANEMLAASVHGTLTPSSGHWIMIKFREDSLNRVYQVRRWLEYVSDLLLLALQQSNFNNEIHEVYLDTSGLGTGNVLVQERPVVSRRFNGLLFKAYPLGAYCVEENPAGKVDTVFREFKFTARQAYMTWGGRVGQRVMALLNDSRDEEVEFLHTVYPTEGETRLPWTSVVMEAREKLPVSTRGFWSFPYMTVRWLKSSDEIYGRGPGHTALPDVRTLNKAKELGLKSWAKALDPPTFETDDGVVGTLKMSPGSRNVVKNKDSIWWFESKARFDVEKIKSEDLKQSIRNIFFMDQLQLKESPAMTATEIHVRYQLMQQVLGPTVGRFEDELLNPLIDRVMSIMLRTGGLPPIPQEIRRYYGLGNLNVEYEGPLAKAQRLGEIRALSRWGAVIADLMVINPEVADNVDSDEVARISADALGVPIRAVKSIEDVKALRKARAAKVAEMQQKQEMMALAEGVGKAAPALKALKDMGGIREMFGEAGA